MHKDTTSSTNVGMIRLPRAAINAIQERDFTNYIQMGYLGALREFELIKEVGSWPDVSHI